MNLTHVMGGGLSQRYYVGSRYEVDLHEELLYLGGDAYNATAVYKKEGNNWNIYYICRDYLGSVCSITNSSGQEVANYSYDAWRRLRNPETLDIYSTLQETPVLFLNRGFTGHGHLRYYGLINMNARIYDPVIGRFHAPDPYVQMADFTHNYNRYSYVLNNPLIYTDEDGEWIHLLIGGLVGGTIT